MVLLENHTCFWQLSAKLLWKIEPKIWESSKLEVHIILYENSAEMFSGPRHCKPLLEFEKRVTLRDRIKLFQPLEPELDEFDGSFEDYNFGDCFNRVGVTQCNITENQLQPK